MTGVQVTDLESAGKAIKAIQSMGIEQVVITAGKDGAYTCKDNEIILVPSFPVKAVDTVAAGDTFCGALCVASPKDLLGRMLLEWGTKRHPLP